MADAKTLEIINQLKNIAKTQVHDSIVVGQITALVMNVIFLQWN